MIQRFPSKPNYQELITTVETGFSNLPVWFIIILACIVFLLFSAVGDWPKAIEASRKLTEPLR